MVFLRRNRDRNPGSQLLAWRVGIFFLAAGIWLTGLLAGDDRITGVAIVVLLLGVLLRFVPRRSVPDGEEEEHQEEVR